LISDDELNAMLQQAVNGSGAPAQLAPVDVAAERAKLQQAGGDMTDSGGEDLPAGTKVNFAAADVSAPEPSRIPIQPKVVDLSAQPKDDLDIAYAKAKDAQARQRMGFERGAREVVGALTRTAVPGIMQRNTGAEAALRAQRKLQDETQQRNENLRLGSAKFDYERKTEAQKAAEAKARDERDFTEKEKEFKYRQEHDAASLAQQKDNAEAQRAMAGATLASTNKDRASGDLSSLRKEFNALPDVKAFTEVDGSFKKIESSATNDSPAGDLALITGFMKIIDPGSSVKEGEFANAENAGGVPDKLRARYNAIVNGERLSPAQRADFLKQAKALHDVHKKRYEDQAERYRTLAKRQGADPDDVVAMPSRSGAAKTVTATPEEDAAALEWAKLNRKDPRAQEILRLHGVQ
jgi:hypothetical protein